VGFSAHEVGNASDWKKATRYRKQILKKREENSSPPSIQVEVPSPDDVSLVSPVTVTTISPASIMTTDSESTHIFHQAPHQLFVASHLDSKTDGDEDDLTSYVPASVGDTNNSTIRLSRRKKQHAVRRPDFRASKQSHFAKLTTLPTARRTVREKEALQKEKIDWHDTHIIAHKIGSTILAASQNGRLILESF
jgi:hypothetical protein